MKYTKDYKDGDRVFDIYFCKFKSSAVTKNGKNYDNVIIQDKTGTLDAKIWDPNNVGIADFEAMDYIEVYGDITSFNGTRQVNVKRVRRCEEGEYDESEYMPVSRKNLDEMYAELSGRQHPESIFEGPVKKVFCGGCVICVQIQESIGG